MITKSDKIRRDLLNGRAMTAMDAWTDYGMSRMSSLIYHMRQAEIPVQTEMITVKDRDGKDCTVARYSVPESYRRMLRETQKKVSES